MRGRSYDNKGTESGKYQRPRIACAVSVADNADMPQPINFHLLLMEELCCGWVVVGVLSWEGLTFIGDDCFHLFDKQ